MLFHHQLPSLSGIVDLYTDGQINQSEKLAPLIKQPLVSSWRRQNRYGFHYNPVHVILLNMLPKLPKPFLRQFKLKQYFL